MISIVNQYRPTNRPDLAATQLHNALLEKQNQANEASGDFLFIELIIGYDGMFQVKLNNIEADHGDGESFDLDFAAGLVLLATGFSGSAVTGFSTTFNSVGSTSNQPMLFWW